MTEGSIIRIRPGRRQLIELTVLGAGTAMEWLDWSIYATFPVFFATQFFGVDYLRFAWLETLAVFAVGRAARRGRRAAMTL